MNSENKEVYRIHKTILADENSAEIVELNLINEVSLFMKLNSKEHSVLVHSGGDEIALAAGFCLSQGIASAECIAGFDFEQEKTDTVNITAKNISQPEKTIPNRKIKINVQKALDLIESLHFFQELRKKTKACHAAALCNFEYKIISAAEDVGRHNAVDKSIGKLILERKLFDSRILILSSRISGDLALKADRAGIGMILSVSRPTALALEIGKRHNISLACLAPGNGLYIFCGEDYIQ